MREVKGEVGGRAIIGKEGSEGDEGRGRRQGNIREGGNQLLQECRAERF